MVGRDVTVGRESLQRSGHPVHPLRRSPRRRRLRDAARRREVPSSHPVQSPSGILNALRPSMLGVNGALLLCTASPYARKGTMWDAFTTHYAADGDPVLFWKAPTWEMYPGVDRELLDLERARDPVVFAAEYGAEFRQDLDGFISRDVVDAIVVKGRVGIPPQPGVRHFAFVDTSGGGGTDSLTIAIARAGGPKVQLCRVSEWKAPYSPVDKAPEVATIAREYGVSKVVGDNFSSGVWADLV